MKISMINPVQHRELPDDFTQQYHSIWVDLPWHEVASPEQYHRFYWDSIDELTYAVDRGFDAVAFNEHHQNAFGGLPNPNIFAGALAYATRDREVGLLQIGSTLPTTAPPNRVAEEYAMLDVLSGGRLLAGMPVGTPMDGTLCYGLQPLTQRERYYEAHDLIMKAWSAEEPFPWNGKYFQLPCVNTWPRPMQQPHPPIWVPGTVSPSTWDFVAEHDYAYMVLTAFSGQLGITDSIRLVKGFWERAEKHGRDRNPFRAGLALMPVIGDSMAQIERDYFEHIKYTFAGTTHIAPEHLNPPGYQSYSALLDLAKRGSALDTGRFEGWTFKDYVDNEIVVAGTAAEVAERLEYYVREMNAGHLMVMLQLGSMPKELTREAIDRFAEGVMPRLRPLFEDEWENRWWPERLRGPRSDADLIGAGER